MSAGPGCLDRRLILIAAIEVGVACDNGHLGGRESRNQLNNFLGNERAASGRGAPCGM